MPTYEDIPVNLNDEVEFTLTEEGARIWNEGHEAKYRAASGYRIGGALLWELFQVFGPHTHLGQPASFFEDNEIHFKQPRDRVPPILPAAPEQVYQLEWSPVGLRAFTLIGSVGGTRIVEYAAKVPNDITEAWMVGAIELGFTATRFQVTNWSPLTIEALDLEGVWRSVPIDSNAPDRSRILPSAAKAPKPKVIQIEVYQRPSGISGYMTERVLIALKDDGTLWQSAGGNEWEQVEGP